MNSFESALSDLVNEWRGKGADTQSMVNALNYERSRLLDDHSFRIAQTGAQPKPDGE